MNNYKLIAITPEYINNIIEEAKVIAYEKTYGPYPTGRGATLVIMTTKLFASKEQRNKHIIEHQEYVKKKMAEIIPANAIKMPPTGSSLMFRIPVEHDNSINEATDAAMKAAIKILEKASKPAKGDK